ncbi:MAG: hypothetical protein OCC49_03465 [Fibrobacterales bacterium]
MNKKLFEHLTRPTLYTILKTIIGLLCLSTTLFAEPKQNMADTLAIAVNDSSAITTGVLLADSLVVDTPSNSPNPRVSIQLDSLALDSLTPDSLAIDSLTAEISVHPDSIHLADSSRFAVFVQVGTQFVDFDQRSKFEAELSKTESYLKEASTASVKREDRFETVNFTIPLYLGITAKINHDISISGGIGYFVYTNDLAIISQSENKSIVSSAFEYNLTATPLFLEYKHMISDGLFTIKDVRSFSISFRWYWFLSETYITATNRPILDASEHIDKEVGQSDFPYDYSTEDINTFHKTKKLTSTFNPLGNGGGVYLGYEFAQWRSITLEGDIGVSFVKIESNDPWSTLLPLTETPTEEEQAILTKEQLSEEQASWNFGGISLHVKFAYYFGKMEAQNTDKRKRIGGSKSGLNNNSSNFP